MSDPHGQETLESMSQAVWYNQWTIKKFESFLHGDILEVGCGIGNFTDKLTEYGRVFAIDYNQSYVSILKKDRHKYTAGLGDIEEGRFFFDSQKFDTIVCLNVLEHIKDDKKALENIFKLLKKDGHLILLVPAFNLLYGEIDRSIGHYRRYYKNQLIKQFQQLGFRLIKIRTMNLIGAIGWFVAGKILGRKTVDSGGVKLFSLFAPLFLPIEDIIEPPIGTSILAVVKK